MTLGEILGYVDFYFEKDEETGNLFIYDYSDSEFEEKAETVYDALDIVSGHLQSEAYGLVEWISEETNEAVVSTSGWTWADYADWIKSRLPNLPADMKNSCQFAVDVFTALDDPKTIDVRE